MSLRVAELETLFTANVDQFEKGATQVDTRRKALDKAPTTVKVDADAKPAVEAMDRVEAQGKVLAGRTFDPQVDADIVKAERKVADVTRELDVLRRMDASPQVDADIAKAESSLGAAQARLRALQGLRAEMVVGADTASAEKALDDVAGKATAAGTEGGRGAGKNLAGGIVAALATIPVAGAVVGIGKAIGESLLDGLQNEVRTDRLMAQTGLDPATVGTLARAAGEAYANNFGESIAGNVGAARTAVQSRLLDPAATKRDAQDIIQSLTGVTDLLEEDVPRVARSAGQLLRTGLAKDAQHAFDIIVKGQQAGLNVSEDWLDTIDEYSTQWRKLGLDGGQVLGLLSQGVRAGARDTDIAADALKEFSIRAIDGSKLTKEGFDAIGLSAEGMSARIARGGPDAAAALDETLDRLRQVEDPAARSAAAVALFGTQAEDMGEALFALDLTTAVDQLGQVEGAAKTALAAVSDNAAGDIATAQRNIEVATDGIKGALAAAFNPEIEGFATFVSSNREQVVQFLLDIANGGLDAGRAVVEGTAAGTEALGDFMAGPIADLILAAADAAVAIDGMFPGDQKSQQFKEWADDAVTGLQGVRDDAYDAADTMRTELIDGALTPAQAKLNEFGDGLLADARVHDATVQLAKDLDAVGYAADGATRLTDAFTTEIDGTANVSAALDAQLRAVVAGLDEQARAGAASGQTQEALTARYEEGRAALVRQLEQMGLTSGQAQALADKYNAVPGKVSTFFQAETAQAQAEVDDFVRRNTGRVIRYKGEFEPAQTAPQGAMVRAASGGAIFGPGTGTSDSVPALLSNGEHVLTAAEVVALGGHDAVYRMRAAARRGDVPGFALGGPVEATPVPPRVVAPQPAAAPVTAVFTDAQVERLARAFETGAARSAGAVLAADHRAQAGTRQTKGRTW